MVNDKDRVNDCTTSNFSGMISVLDPEGSWAAKWSSLGKFAPGCYALSVVDDLPEDIQGILQDNNINYRPPSEL